MQEAANVQQVVSGPGGLGVVHGERNSSTSFSLYFFLMLLFLHTFWCRMQNYRYLYIIIIPILKLLEDQKKGNIKFYEKQMFGDTLLCYVCVSTR